MRFTPRTKNQANEIVFCFYDGKRLLEERLQALGIEWSYSTFEDELVGLRQRLNEYNPRAGISLTEDEEHELAFWIEQRVFDAVHRVVEACLLRKVH